MTNSSHTHISRRQ